MEFELKQNPAPMEWAVLIKALVDNRKEIVTVVTFKGENALQLATDYRDLSIALQSGLVSIQLKGR
jgi:hypothetical protein